MKTKHILLAEDNEGDILLTKECLAEADGAIKLSVVRDGKEAEEFVCRQGPYINALPPDLILLDINLPKKTGIEVLKYIKGHADLKHIPVIILSTSGNEKDVNRACCNYANAYIVKPPEADDYLAKIKSLTDFWLHAAELPKAKQDCA